MPENRSYHYRMHLERLAAIDLRVINYQYDTFCNNGFYRAPDLQRSRVDKMIATYQAKLNSAQLAKDDVKVQVLTAVLTRLNVIATSCAS
jgi:hypothetical protein